MFEVSYIWIGFYAVLTVVVIGLIVSVLTGRGRAVTVCDVVENVSLCNDVFLQP